MICKKSFYFSSIILSFQLISCDSKTENNNNTLFELLSSETTKIDFENNITYTNEFNIYTYRNFYNGGGVGLGDVNNDGLLDIYLTANQLSNRLYINKGNFVRCY